MNLLRRVTGLGAAGSLALALLGGGCVFAATIGPRLAQATSTRALQQTLDRVPPPANTIVVSSSWTQITGALMNASATLLYQSVNNAFLTQKAIGGISDELRHDFGSGPLPLSPRTTDWMGMTSAMYAVAAPPPSLGGIPAQLEVSYRTPAANHLRLLAGSMPDSAPQPTTTPTQVIFDLRVVVTPQTASRFGLRPGSRLDINGPVDVMEAGKLVVIHLDVTGIVTPADPHSSFWTADPLIPAPALDHVGGAAMWEGGVIADPGESAMVQGIFGQAGLLFRWDFPADTTGLHVPAQVLYTQENRMAGQAPLLTGELAPARTALSVSFGLIQPLAAFVQAANDVNVLLWIVYAGLAAAGIVTLLLGARMVAARRSAELALRRARGASLWQLFALGTLGAALPCVPAAALAWAAAVLLVPAVTPAGPVVWWPGVATLVLAITVPGAAAAWQHRLARRRRAWQRLAWLPRVVFEVTACLAAAAGITVFRLQSGTTDLFASMAPVLIAVPAVIVALRLYQLVLRALARASARQRGVIGFLGLSRASQTPLTLVLPALTLVLILTVAAFTGMVKAAVVRGETAVSWQVTGADVVLASPGQYGMSGPAVHAVSAVPGVRNAVAVRSVPLTVDQGTQVVTGIIVDPASYAKLVAATQGFPPFGSSLLTEPTGGGTIPVLASPQAAAYLSGPAGSVIPAQDGLPELRVQITGEPQSTPALPGNGEFIVLPSSALRGASAPPPVNLMLLTGPSIDMTRLHAVVAATMPGPGAPYISTRSQAFQGLAGAPLQQGTFLLFSLAIAYAAALALAVMLLELALGTADREVTTARLATMGLSEGQRVRLVAIEVLPAIAASAIAAGACAIALPRLVAPAIDLSAFTHTPASVPLRPDFTSFLLPLGALLVISVIALAYEVRSRRGRGIAVTMRT